VSGEHRFQRRGAGGEQDRVAGDHQRTRLTIEHAQRGAQRETVRMRRQHALERLARVFVRHRHHDLQRLILREQQ